MKKKLMLIGLVILVIAGGFAVKKYLSSKKTTTSFQTATATKGTLVNTVSASGSVTTGGNVTISTSATGIVKNVFVKNGDKVFTGQQIATLSLDQASSQKQAAAWASYLGAKNSLDSAKNKLNTLQASAFSVNQKFINDAVARNLSTDDPTYIQENATWLAAEADYKNQATAISQAQASLSSAWISYQQASAIITAAASGTIQNLAIAPGVSTTGSSVGNIKVSEAKTQASINLSEIDVLKVKPGQKVTITLDAFPNKTFTGSVMAIDTSGQVSSGVTTYPAILGFDSAPDNIYPNMAISAKIITNIENDVLLVPTSSIKTTNGQSTVEVLKDGKTSTKNIEIGSANDTQTVVVSGLVENDIVVTGSTGTSIGTSSSATSPFSAIGGNRGFTTGAVRLQSR